MLEKATDPMKRTVVSIPNIRLGNVVYRFATTPIFVITRRLMRYYVDTLLVRGINILSVGDVWL